MKSVLISIHPKYCELIANGKKTVEVRKTKPKLETPFKVYIYCTKPKNYYKISSCMAATDENLYLSNGKVKMSDGFEFWANGVEYEHLNGKVIGEFVCDEVEQGHILWVKEQPEYYDKVEEKSQLTYRQMFDYFGEKGIGYFWHISNLVIYDEPKELSKFEREYKYQCGSCDIVHLGKEKIKRPPQSWCYVESEVKGE